MGNFEAFLESTGRVYVRFGTWRPQEYSTNYALGQIEAGVSVFEAVPQGDKYRILLDEAHDPDDRQKDTLSGLVAQIRRARYDDTTPDPIFIVTGTQVGTGYDGDPLLKGIKVVQEIQLEQLVAPEIGLK